MPPLTPKDMLHRYLQEGRDALVWKVTGLSEYDIRRPLTPTGTNLLGLVKHVAGCEIGYFGGVFGRPLENSPAWLDDETEPNVDMWATADESRGEIIGLYQRAWAHSDETIRVLDLEDTGVVDWWRPESRQVTLHRILVHMIAETHRHAGQADIIRELIDGTVGLYEVNDNIPAGDAAFWAEHRTRVQRAAEAHSLPRE
ncbi:DinB family protein [Marisediminicola senii]|uniref:DinB family protein n=1 Tax=Marisediminicola senii TaxID=2711233 RepID=UPI0013EC09FC|nr:DinB family protein [Marisediminicola senii]